ncbi:glycosyl transferase [Leifsonia sp. LS1]|uniref:glycosyltransferase n=1 Tax=Leifsonia sp. LS1 TaxID=2828483 RepID=UPI001CFE3344|nr:nucleotide disphospho-sugar-binding domain-containing protein [Leifsonia sp. LS1]GIT81166.1 glycosyl transferase [Leifsonia sp. LS1]
MRTVLLCANPLYGHVNPMLAIGRDLAAHGDRVIVLTGSRYASAAVSSGLEVRSFHGVADFDEHDPRTFVPHAHRYSGLALSQYQIESTFIRPIPDQWRAMSAVLAEEEVDAVLVDSLFLGALPLMQRPSVERVPVLVIGIGPLAQLSVDTPPANSRIPMASGPLARARNRILNEMARRVFFAHAQKLAGRLLVEAGGRKPDGFVIEISRMPERYLQLGPREFEYERRDLSENIRFVGPLPAAVTSASAGLLPDWWSDISDDRPLVHVTQGTLDNNDPTTVIRPTIDALADLDVQVVVSTGRAPIESVGPVPANARIAEFLPYDQLLPRCDVMVTNGGYGGVMAGLTAGVPLVVAGAAEDKPEVAARVEYFGAGLDLRTGRPTPDRVRSAVQTILADGAFRQRAADLSSAIAGYDPFTSIRTELDGVLGVRHG